MTVRKVLDYLDEEIQARRTALRRLQSLAGPEWAGEVAAHEEAIRRLGRRKESIIQACAPTPPPAEKRRCRGRAMVA
jgi:hypothetical protein